MNDVAFKYHEHNSCGTVEVQLEYQQIEIHDQVHIGLNYIPLKHAFSEILI